MSDSIVQQIARLMREQAVAYKRLEAAAKRLSISLVRGAPDSIETITKTGESELIKMRSRLLQITAVLTAFTEERAKSPEKTVIGTEVRSEFEAAAKELLEAARSFEKMSNRASSLALGGSSFATACIQVCGVPPSTYRAPVIKPVEERAAEKSTEENYEY